MVHGVAPDDFYTRIADTSTVEDAAKKHLYTVPEYVLSITRHNPGSRNDTPVRVVTFHREDLLPYQQDLYDKGGNLETEVSYGQYADFNGSQFPSVVTIKRPMEGIQLVMTIERVVENPKLTDDQFQIKIPKEPRFSTWNRGSYRPRSCRAGAAERLLYDARPVAFNSRCRPRSSPRMDLVM